MFLRSNSPGEENKKKRKLFDLISNRDGNVNRSRSLNTSKCRSGMFDISEGSVNEKEIDKVGYIFFIFAIFLF